MISIAPLARTDVDKVAHLQLPPARRGCAPRAAFDAPQGDLYAIRHGDDYVGFFQIQPEASATDPRLPHGAITLCHPVIGGQYQRFGYGADLLALLPSALGRAYPQCDAAFVRVDAENSPAIRAYLAHGWRETGLPLRDAKTGPERTLTLSLVAPTAC